MRVPDLLSSTCQFAASRSACRRLSRPAGCVHGQGPVHGPAAQNALHGVSRRTDRGCGGACPRALFHHHRRTRTSQTGHLGRRPRPVHPRAAVAAVQSRRRPQLQHERVGGLLLHRPERQRHLVDPRDRRAGAQHRHHPHVRPELLGGHIPPRPVHRISRPVELMQPGDQLPEVDLVNSSLSSSITSSTCSCFRYFLSTSRLINSVCNSFRASTGAHEKA